MANSAQEGPKGNGRRTGQVVAGTLAVLVLLGGCLGGAVSWRLKQNQQTCSQLRDEALTSVHDVNQSSESERAGKKAEASARIVLANKSCFEQAVINEVKDAFPQLAAQYASRSN